MSACRLPGPSSAEHSVLPDPAGKRCGPGRAELHHFQYSTTSLAMRDNGPVSRTLPVLKASLQTVARHHRRKVPQKAGHFESRAPRQESS
jgi:hypothetical protein